MRILLLISEAWNDRLHPNNNMTNWFNGMPDVEIATVYANPALPDNKCCKKYFQLSEMTMVKSLIGGPRAGRSFNLDPSKYVSRPDIKEESHSVYQLFKSASNNFVRLTRDLIWKFGKINIKELRNFINDFNPDIIFSQRMGSVKMCRLERLVKKIADVPIVAYTGDDEYSLNQISYSPLYWIRRFWVRHELKKNIPMYDLFYSMSEEQMNEFRKAFGSNMKFLVKTGDFDKEKIHRQIHNPMVITYAGKLYCNRWKTLAMLAECISQINEQGGNFVLNIFTRDKVSSKQRQILNTGVYSFIKGGVSADELKEVYNNSDILLHVESFDKANSLAVRYSFSTKIMECMSSGCAVMAIGKRDQAGCSYLKRQDAAIVASSQSEILEILLKLSTNTSLINEYALKAYNCGRNHHNRELIQAQIKSDFLEVMSLK